MAEQSVGKLVAELIFKTGDSVESLNNLANVLEVLNDKVKDVTSSNVLSGQFHDMAVKIRAMLEDIKQSTEVTFGELPEDIRKFLNELTDEIETLKEDMQDLETTFEDMGGSLADTPITPELEQMDKQLDEMGAKLEELEAQWNKVFDNAAEKVRQSGATQETIFAKLEADLRNLLGEKPPSEAFNQILDQLRAVHTGFAKIAEDISKESGVAFNQFDAASQQTLVNIIKNVDATQKKIHELYEQLGTILRTGGESPEIEAALTKTKATVEELRAKFKDVYQAAADAARQSAIEQKTAIESIKPKVEAAPTGGMEATTAAAKDAADAVKQESQAAQESFTTNKLLAEAKERLAKAMDEAAAQAQEAAGAVEGEGNEASGASKKSKELAGDLDKTAKKMKELGFASGEAAEQNLKLALAKARVKAATGDITNAFVILHSALAENQTDNEQLRLRVEASAEAYYRQSRAAYEAGFGTKEHSIQTEKNANQHLLLAQAQARLKAETGDVAGASALLTAALAKETMATEKMRLSTEALATRYRNQAQAQEELRQKNLAMSTSSGQVQQTLGNLMFLVQDAPYGFRGMANNIDPVVRGFLMLRAEAGGTTQALRILLATFTGPVGLMFTISTFVALLQIIPAMLDKMNKGAKEAADEGLKDFEDVLKNINNFGQLRVKFNVDDAVKGAKKELQDLTRRETVLTFNPELLNVRAGSQQQRDLLEATKQRKAVVEGDLEIMEKMKESTDTRIQQERRLRDYAEQGQKVILNNMPLILDLEKQIKKIQEDRAKVAKDSEWLIGNDFVNAEAKIRDYTDKIVALEEQKRKILQSSNDIIKDQVAEAESNYKTNFDLAGEYKRILQYAVEHTTDMKEKRSYQEKIVQLAQDELERREKIAALERKFQEQRVTNKYEIERRQALQNFEEEKVQINKLTHDKVEQLRLIEEARRGFATQIINIDKKESDDKVAYERKILDELTTNEYDNKRAAAIIEFERRKDEIKELYTDELEQKKLITEAERAMNNKLHNLDLAEIKARADFEAKINEQISDNKFVNERRKILDEYNARKEQIQILYDDETKRKQLINDADKAYRMQLIDISRREYEEISKRDEERMTRLAEGLSKIGKILEKSGDDFLSKMVDALRVAIEIAKTIEAANRRASTEGKGFGVEDIVNIGAMILGFDKGGYTGDGSTNQVAGIAHKGEVVYEKSITDPNKEQLLDLRKLLQTGKSFDEAVGLMSGFQNLIRVPIPTRELQTVFANVDLTPVASEVKKLREDNARLYDKIGNMKAEVDLSDMQLRIDLDNLTGTFRKEFTKLQQYLERKNVAV